MVASVSRPSEVTPRESRLRPVVRELAADLDTPVSAYLKLAAHPAFADAPSFLLESVAGGETLARYSFIGVVPRASFVAEGGRVVRREAGRAEAIESVDALIPLQAELQRYSMEQVPGLPRFLGGLVGYLGYEAVRAFEPKLARLPDLPADPTFPDAVFLLADTLVAFDHARGRMLLIALADESTAGAAQADAKLGDIQAALSGPLPTQPTGQGATGPIVDRSLHSNFTRGSYAEVVRRAKEHIAAGDIFQVVPSQRLSRRTSAEPFRIYRQLRRLNPSPYMFYFDFGSINGQPMHLIGASPEMHVRLENGMAMVRPIAGTRPRGETHDQDVALERELLADPKELAEHAMLVDLGRNDVGRVAEYGTVTVAEKMVVERYSHVMHIVSHVQGRLRAGLTAFDLMRATFPAGTVSGAPKVRAMEIIHDLEGLQRGPYAGAVGYFSFDGAMDTCIAIRTMVHYGDRVYVQAGGGLVADSDPDREYEETLNKARALLVAIDQAETEV